MTIQEQRRKAFELKYADEIPPALEWDEERQTYHGNSMFWLWTDRLKMWCEALDSVEVDLPDQYTYSNPDTAGAAIFDCATCIKAAGVRVKP